MTGASGQSGEVQRVASVPRFHNITPPLTQLKKEAVAVTSVCPAGVSCLFSGLVACSLQAPAPVTCQEASVFRVCVFQQVRLW